MSTATAGLRVATLCARKGPHAKSQIEHLLGLTPYQAQQAIDWCKVQRLIVDSPFLCVYENGTRRWTYGYRSAVLDLEKHFTNRLRDLRTRSHTIADDLEHTLMSKGGIATVLTPRQRTMISNHRTQIQGMALTLDTIAVQIESLV